MSLVSLSVNNVAEHLTFIDCVKLPATGSE